MYDLNTGQLLSSYELLGNLSEKWDTLDTNTKNYIASTIAGTHQLNNFLALMNNFDHAIEATETALNSAGSAARENSRYMGGLEAKTQAVKASFQELANSVIDSGLVKGILDLANGFLKLLNTPIGNFVTQMTLLTGVFWGGTGLIKAMKLIPAFFSTAATAINGFTGVLSLTAPQLMLVAAGISAILAIAPAISDWWKGFTNDVEYLEGKLEEVNGTLETNKQRLEDLNNVPYASRTAEINAEIEFLEKENAELEKLLENWNKKRIQGELDDYRGAGYQSYIIKGSSGEDIELPFDTIVAGEQEAIERLKAWGYEYENLGDKIEDFGYTLEESNQQITTNDAYISNIINRQQELQSKLESGAKLTADETEEYAKNNAVLVERLELYNEATGASIGLTQAEEESIPVIEQLTEGYKKLSGEIFESEDILDALSEGYNLNNAQAEELKRLYPELSGVIEDNNGVWKLNQQALYDVAVQGNETARAMVNAQIENTQKTIEGIKKRITAYQKEIAVLRSLVGTETGIFGAVFDALGTAVTDVPDLPASLMKELEDTKNFLTELKAQTETWDPEVTGFNTGNGGGTSKETDTIKEQSDAFKELNEIIEHNIFLREKQGANEQELINLYKDYQNQLNKEANWFRKQGLDENSEYIRNLQKQWWELENTITNLQHQAFDNRLKISEDYIEDRNDLSNWGADSEIAAYQRVLDWMDEWYKNDLVDYEYYWEKRKEIAKKQAEAIKELLEKIQENRIENTENQIKDMESLFGNIAKKAQEEIDILESQKEAIEQKYQDQIDAIEKVNDELERQIELEEAMDDLARARQAKVMVYKDGRFQYVEDIDQVSEAQSNLDRLQREEQKRKDIEALEAQRDAEIKLIDESIKYWEDYVKKYGDYVDDFAEEQERKLLEQKYGIKLEGENWELSLKQFEDYIKEYKRLQEELTSLESMGNISSSDQDWSQIWLDADKAYKDGIISKEEADAIKDYAHSQKEQEMAGSGVTFNPGSGKWTSSGSSSSSNKTDWSQVWKDAQKDYESGKISEAEKNKIQNEAHKNKQEEMTGSGATFNPSSGKWHYASGTLSAHGGLSLVGEKGPELRVLNQGDGIIPANATKNLMELSKYSIKDILASKGQIMYSYMFDKIILPNVTDFNSFVNELKKFKQFAYQQ